MVGTTQPSMPLTFTRRVKGKTLEIVFTPMTHHRMVGKMFALGLWLLWGRSTKIALSGCAYLPALKSGKPDRIVAVLGKFLLATTALIIQRLVKDDTTYFGLGRKICVRPD